MLLRRLELLLSMCLRHAHHDSGFSTNAGSDKAARLSAAHAPADQRALGEASAGSLSGGTPADSRRRSGATKSVDSGARRGSDDAAALFSPSHFLTQ